MYIKNIHIERTVNICSLCWVKIPLYLKEPNTWLWQLLYSEHRMTCFASLSFIAFNKFGAFIRHHSEDNKCEKSKNDFSFFILPFFSLFAFWCSLGWPELRILLPLSASGVLGFQACTVMPSFSHCLLSLNHIYSVTIAVFLFHAGMRSSVSSVLKTWGALLVFLPTVGPGHYYLIL